MNHSSRNWVVLALASAAVVVMALAGCSSNKAPAVTTSSSQAAPPAAPAVGEAEHGESAETVTPAGTIGEIWTQIAAEQGKMTAAIQNGQLKDVHHLAFAIRDLVVALADKAKAASPASAAHLDGLVAQVKTSASTLDELGDAGNLSGTQTEYAKLEAILGAIKNVASGQ